MKGAIRRTVYISLLFAVVFLLHRCLYPYPKLDNPRDIVKGLRLNL